jgi:hypothetical protein
MTIPQMPPPPQSRPLPLSSPGAAAHPPPFPLPGLHFGSALAWLVLGALGLTAVAPRIAGGDVFAPPVFAVTHLFTLGVVTSAIFGALYQFFPAALGVAARSVRVGLAGGWLLAAGVAAIVAGFWRWSPALQGAGWVLLFFAVGCVAWNLLPQRRKARQHRHVGLYVSAGHSALGFAMLLGLARIGEAAGWWAVDRLGSIAAHYHLAAFGFCGLTAVGVGSRMLPMFLVADGTPGWALRTILPTAGAGLVLYAVGQVFHLSWLAWPGALLLLGAGAVYLHLVAGYFRGRSATPLDHGMSHVAASFGFLALAVATGAAMQFGLVGGPRWWAAYVLLAVPGWLTLFVLGVLYRILPFLSWLHLFGGRRLDGAQVTVQLLSRPRWAWAALALLAPGLLGLVAGVAAGAGGLARVGAAVYAAGAIVTAAHWTRLAVLRLRSESPDLRPKESR